MLLDPRRPIRDAVRRFIGTKSISHHLADMEERMATITEALTALAEQVNAVSAAQATSFHNLQAAIDKLKSGELTAEQQDAVDQIEQSLTTMAADAQAADDGVEPADNGGQGGGTPPTDGGDTPDVPAENA
jgi:uncharacterized protein (DUF3084 family)